MAIKGQKFRTYSEEVMKEAIRLYIEEKWPYRKITEHLGIQDMDRVRKWISRYRQLDEFGLLDQRGRREEYLNHDRYSSRELM